MLSTHVIKTSRKKMINGTIHAELEVFTEICQECGHEWVIRTPHRPYRCTGCGAYLGNGNWRHKKVPTVPLKTWVCQQCGCEWKIVIMTKPIHCHNIKCSSMNWDRPKVIK
jgi:predicted Zn-ribbon and HTH transcriptional regulator